MNTKDITLTFNGTLLPRCTSVDVQLSQAVDAATPLPRSNDDDGWDRYTAGMLTWTVTAECLFDTDQAAALTTLTSDVAHALVVTTPLFTLSGTALLTQAQLTGLRCGLARYALTFACNDFPTLTT